MIILVRSSMLMIRLLPSTVADPIPEATGVLLTCPDDVDSRGNSRGVLVVTLSVMLAAAISVLLDATILVLLAAGEANTTPAALPGLLVIVSSMSSGLPRISVDRFSNA